MDTQDIKASVRNLIEEAVHAIDDERYEDWPELFTERCLYQIVTSQALALGQVAGLMTCQSRGMLMDRVNSLRKANIYEPHRYRHLLGPTRLLPPEDNGVQRASTGFAVLRIVQGGQTDLFLSGTYQDRITLDSSPPRFQERSVVLDSSRIDTLIVLPV